jgi:hypothetical protein
MNIIGVRPLYFAVAFALSIAFLSSPEIGSAQEEARFRLGNLEIHPQIDISVKDDNNIFKKKTGEKSDTIFTYVPEINFVVKIPGSKESNITAGFKYEIIDFNKFGGEDVENSTTKGGMNLERLGGNWYSRTDGQWLDTSDASSSETQSTTGARTPRTEGKFDSKIGVGGYNDKGVQDKTHFEVSAGLTRNRYDRSGQDRLENNLTSAGLLAEFAISQKTSLRFIYGFKRTRFTNRASTAQNDDARDHSLRAGFSFNPSALISGKATVGAVFRLLDNRDRNDGSDRDTTGISANVDLTWNARPSKTTVNFTFTSGIENASTPGQFGFRKWKLGGRLTQGLFFISNNLELNIAPSFENNTFIEDSANRKDNLVTVKADVKYSAPSRRFPWFAALELTRDQKTTNVNKSSIEYNQTTYSLKVGVKY